MRSAETLFTLAISPSGHLILDASLEGAEVPLSHHKLQESEIFVHDVHQTLLKYALQNRSDLSPHVSYWKDFTRFFIMEVCRQNTQAVNNELLMGFPSVEIIQDWKAHAPFMRGAEYLNEQTFANIWQALAEALQVELQSTKKSLQEYLNQADNHWHLVGRICFHLAENKSNDRFPFAFLVTYTKQLSSESKLQHVPLQRALEEYGGQKNKNALLSLLLPIQNAAEKSPFIKTLVDAGEIYQPQLWTIKEAHRFLSEIPLFEQAGVIVRVPNWWNSKKPPRPKVSVSVGQVQSTLGLDAMVDFNVALSLPNEIQLDSKEWQELLASKEGLVKIKGQWVEIDADKLQQVLSHWEGIRKEVKENGLSFSEGMRLLSGLNQTETKSKEGSAAPEWSELIAGDWLKKTLDELQQPSAQTNQKLQHILNQYLHATLRPYQQAGVHWLWLLYSLKLGGCLADDMGLGKTIQLLSLLLLIKYQSKTKCPHLLVVPASLLGNWQAEAVRFAPDLKILVAHPSMDKSKTLSTLNVETIRQCDVVITTYAYLYRLPVLQEYLWDLVVLDEAQQIKNPNSKQTRAVKNLKSRVRFSLTGTPIENRLSDLWSLFDFTLPGLLGSHKSFSEYGKKFIDERSNFFSAIRKLLKPYILRRLKIDKTIIADLPDKTELDAFCYLSKEQAALYQQSVNELARQLEIVDDGMKRRGLVLTYLMRFKQICNHPDQLTGHGSYSEMYSGKFQRLRELAELIAAKQEKVLVFTQFTEIIPSIHALLSKVFGRQGLCLDGSTAIKKRIQFVEEFAKEEGPPFFVLSLKAGGTGLNLTSAAHVIHFDRWWNPAVENQATDRAYRIGQKKNVLVHKFICAGTVEEKIDALIRSKKALSNEILSEENEVILSELGNDELIRLVSLDIHKALGESL